MSSGAAQCHRETCPTVIASAAWQSRRRRADPPREPSHHRPHPHHAGRKIADIHAKRERTPVLYPIHQSDRRTPAGRDLPGDNNTSTPSANERPTSQTGGPQPDGETSYTLRRPHSPAPGNDRSTRLNITSGISGQQSRFNGLKPLRAPACGASDCNSLPRILSPSYSTERVRGGAAGVTSAPCRLSRLPRKPGHGSLALESRRQRSQAVAPTTWTPRPDPRCSTLTDTHQP